MRNILFLFCLIAAISPSRAKEGPQSWTCRLRQETPQSLIAEITFPKPIFFKNEAGTVQQKNPGEGAFRISTYNLYGFFKTLLLPEGASCEIFVKGKEHIIKSGALDLLPADDALMIPTGKDNKIPDIQSTSPFKINNDQIHTELTAELRYAGIMRGEPISYLLVRPYSYKGNGNVAYVETITIRIHLPQQQLLQNITRSPFEVFNKRTFRTNVKNESLLSRQLLKKIPAAPDGYNYKIIIDREGLVRVSAAELLKTGVPLSNIDSRTIQLWNKGAEIPVFVHDRNNGRLEINEFSEEYIEFFGEPNRKYFKNKESDIFGDTETEENIYVLTWGNSPGKRIVEESGAIRITDQSRMTDLRGQSFTSTVFAEKNTVFDQFGGTTTIDTNRPSFQSDQYFWERVTANQSAEFPVELPHPDLLSDEDMTLSVMLRGATAFGKDQLCPGREEHNAEVFINRTRALRASWSGYKNFLANGKDNGFGRIPMTAADAGEKTVLRINNVSDCQLPQERLPSFYTNWIRITYQRLYRAFKNSIPFSIPSEGGSGVYTFYLSEFTRPDVIIYRKGVSRISNYSLNIIKANGKNINTTYSVSFQSYVSSPSEDFYAITEDAVIKPKAIFRDKALQISDPSVDYDYIIITDTTLFNPLLKTGENPVLKLKEFQERERGFKVLVVNIADIHDEFNYGIASKESIRGFLQVAYNTWQVAPRFAVLAGSAQSIPPDYWQTVRWGATPTDYTYGFIEGHYRSTTGEIMPDVFPEIIVGRIPAQNREELENIVQKTIEYHRNPDLDFYRSSVLLIAGDNPQYEAQSNIIAENIPFSVSTRRVFVRSQTNKYFGGTSSLINELDNGAAYINYMGHGGGAVWDDKGLLLPADVRRISNRGKYTVVSSPTCFTGAYEGAKGLLTAFLFEKERGAIATWGNSGYGWTDNSFLLAKSLAERFFLKENRGRTIGELFAEGKAHYFALNGGYSNPIAVTMLLQCNYMGDPALPFGIATKSVTLETETDAATAGENVDFKGNTPFVQGQGIAEFFDEAGNTIAGSSTMINIQNSAFSGTMRIPERYSGRSIGIRIYANDFTKENEAEGSVILSLSSVVFSDISVLPTIIQPGIPVYFKAKISSKSTLLKSFVHVQTIHNDEVYSLDTLLMKNSGLFHYSTEKPLDALKIKEGTQIRFRVIAETSDGEYPSQEIVIRVGGLADPAAFFKTIADSLNTVSSQRAVNSTVSMYATPDGAKLGAQVYNWGENESHNVQVKFLEKDASNILGQTDISIPAHGREQALIAIEPNNFKKKIVRVSLESEGDGNVANNSAYHETVLSCYQISPGIGSTTDGRTFNSVGIENAAILEVESPAQLLAPELVCMQADTASSTLQPGITFLKANGYTSLRISLQNANVPILYGNLRMWYDENDPAIQNAVPAIYRFNERQKTWSRIASNAIAPGVISARIPIPGTFAMGISHDATSPHTSISIEGQLFSRRGSVSPSPRISVVATDENGIHTDADNIIMELDNKRVSKEEFAFLDSASTSHSNAIVYQPKLSDGTHTFCISVMDNNGNQSDRDCIQMEVSNVFQVQMLGQFPNPFSDQTFLAYDILGANTVDEVEVKFYTASGRLIRKLLYPSTDPRQSTGLLQGGTGLPTSIGYHEAWWDGTDEDNNEVANGVYFFKIRIRSGDETVESLGKIARVR